MSSPTTLYWDSRISIARSLDRGACSAKYWSTCVREDPFCQRPSIHTTPPLSVRGGGLTIILIIIYSMSYLLLYLVTTFHATVIDAFFPCLTSILLYSYWVFCISVVLRLCCCGSFLVVSLCLPLELRAAVTALHCPILLTVGCIWAYWWLLWLLFIWINCWLLEWVK